jgi:hypothetical protein
VCHHSSASLNKEKICHEISEAKIAVYKKTQGLRSGNFSDLKSACSKVLVNVKIFQFHDQPRSQGFSLFVIGKAGKGPGTGRSSMYSDWSMTMTLLCK